MMDEEHVYWVWIQSAMGAGSGKPACIFRAFSSLRDFFLAGEREWRLMGIFTEREIEALRAGSPDSAKKLLENCARLDQRVVTLSDAEYPSFLRQIRNPPCVLYVKGKLPDFEARPSVSIVGTRSATESGIMVTEAISCDLARAGVVVVSGGALGIDSAAHRGAVRANGITVCVLGCGIDYHYLMSNAGLRDAIACNGAVISEYPPQTPASPSHFPIRNRIISGLTLGTLVVEAAAKSGSLITVNDAVLQNRDVFAVPCSVTSPVSSGVNGLLKQGAKPVTCARDILEEYDGRFPQFRQSSYEETSVLPIVSPRGKDRNVPCVPAVLPDGLSSDAQAVAKCLTSSPKHSSLLAGESSLSPARLLAALTELELYGIACACSGQRYALASGQSRFC